MPTISPATGSLNVVTRYGMEFRGHTPKVSRGTVISVPVGALSVVSDAPLTIVPRTIEVPVVVVSFAGDPIASTGSQIRAPPAGSIAFTGNNWLNWQGEYFLPSTGSISFTGRTPAAESDQSFTIEPGAGSLSVSTSTPDPLDTGLPKPGTGKLNVVIRYGMQLEGHRPLARSVSWTVTPSSGAITASGVQPGVTVGGNIPQTGSVSLTGHAPYAKGPIGTGSIALTGYLITRKKPGIAVNPTTGSLGISSQTGLGSGSVSFTGYAPATGTAVISPLTGGIQFSGAAPQTAPIVGEGSIAFSGIAPSVRVENPTRIRIIPVGSLTFGGTALSLGFTPRVTLGTVSFAGIAPSLDVGNPQTAGTLAFTGNAPGITVGLSVPSGSLTVSGAAPRLPSRPGKASLVLASTRPRTIVAQPLVPPEEILALSGYSVTLKYALSVPGGSLGITGYAPSAEITHTRKMRVGELEFTGQRPVLVTVDSYAFAARTRMRYRETVYLSSSMAGTAYHGSEMGETLYLRTRIKVADAYYSGGITDVVYYLSEI